MIGPDLAAAIERISAVPRLLIALDFDGTLAPLIEDGSQSRMTPPAAQAVRRLSLAPATTVALVSGRGLDSLSRVSRMPARVLLAGSHGAELAGPGMLAEPTPAEQQRVRGLLAALGGKLDGVPGVQIEAKPYGAAVHWRRTPEPLRAGVRQQALTIAAADPGLVARDGKQLVEFSVRRAHKGESIEALRRLVRATAVLFAGDDRTDEDAFAALRPEDVGIKVGPGRTLAGHRVDSIAGVVAALERIDRR